jgi:hypothetical protein
MFRLVEPRPARSAVGGAGHAGLQTVTSRKGGSLHDGVPDGRPKSIDAVIVQLAAGRPHAAIPADHQPTTKSHSSIAFGARRRAGEHLGSAAGSTFAPRHVPHLSHRSLLPAC